MTPGPLRAEEMSDPAQSLRWHNALRTATVDLERRPRMMLWSAGPLAAPPANKTGTVAIDHPPFKVGAVVLASVQALDGTLDGMMPLAPFSFFRRLTDGRVMVSYSFGNYPVSATKFQLSFLLIEAPA
jgi:hypothetical protein